MSGGKEDFSGRLADITEALALELHVANTEDLAQTCFPGDLEEIFMIAQKSYHGLLNPATARLQTLKAISLAEKVIERLRDKTCQQAASNPSKNSQQKALAAMRKLPMGERATAAFEMYERAHTALAALVCQKNMGLKVSRPAQQPAQKQRPASPQPQRTIPLAEEQKLRAAVFAEQKAHAEAAGIKFKQNDEKVKNADLLVGDEERSEDEEEDDEEDDSEDSWLVSDESDDSDVVADMNDMPDENDSDLKRIRAQHAQVALQRQQKDVANAEARLAQSDVDEEEREALEERIVNLQKDIERQQKIIALAAPVPAPAAAAAAAAAAAPAPLVKRRIMPTLIAGPTTTVPAPAFAPAPVAAAPAPIVKRRITPTLISAQPASTPAPAFTFGAKPPRPKTPPPPAALALAAKAAAIAQNAHKSVAKENDKPVQNGKKTKEQWAKWIRKVQKGKRERRNSAVNLYTTQPTPPATSSSDVIVTNGRKRKVLLSSSSPSPSSSDDVVLFDRVEKKRRGSATTYQVVCDGNKCVRKPQEIIIVGSSSSDIL